VFSSLFVSTLIATIIGVQLDTQEARCKVKTFVLFLRQNKVEAGLAHHLKQLVEKRTQETEMLADEDVPALALLSSPQRADVHLARSKTCLLRHPLFRLWINLSYQNVGEICVEAMIFQILRPMDDLFVSGSTSHHAFYLVRGSLAYHQDPNTSLVGARTLSNVPEESWICEAALWTEWQHVGTASAHEPCQLMSVHAHSLMASLGKNPVIRDVTLEYARIFQQRLALAVPPRCWPSDVCVPGTDFGSIVHSMDSRLQELIGLQAINQIVMDSFFSRCECLRGEVRNGKCSVVVTADGSVERIVCVTALRILRYDGLVLVKVGHFHRGSFTVACTLPGGKLDRGETYGDCAKRVLSTRLHPLSEAVVFTGSMDGNTSEYIAESMKFGVKTRYCRTVCCAQVSKTFQVPTFRRAPAHRQQGHHVATHRDRLLRFSAMMHSESYVIPWDDGRLGVYVWMEESELEAMKGPRYQRYLAEWSRSLEIDRDVVEQRSRWSLVDLAGGDSFDDGTTCSEVCQETLEEDDPDMIRIKL